MPDIFIRSERYCFYYCKTRQHSECPGERHTAMHFGSTEELCTCVCHGKNIAEGSEYRTETIR